jgi:hypothetical protein
MGFEVEIGVGRDGIDHFAGVRGLAVELGNQFFLSVHASNLQVAKTA